METVFHIKEFLYSPFVLTRKGKIPSEVARRLLEDKYVRVILDCSLVQVPYIQE